MTMKQKIEFELGETKFKQRVVLIKEYDGSYTLKKYAVSQLDETDFIGNLTPEILKNILEAINSK